MPAKKRKGLTGPVPKPGGVVGKMRNIIKSGIVMGQGPNGTMYMVVGLITQMFRRATRKLVVVLGVFNLMLDQATQLATSQMGGNVQIS